MAVTTGVSFVGGDGTRGGRAEGQADHAAHRKRGEDQEQDESEAFLSQSAHSSKYSGDSR